MSSNPLKDDREELDKIDSLDFGQDDGDLGLISYDVHLECVLQELTKFAKNLEAQTIESNLIVKVNSIEPIEPYKRSSCPKVGSSFKTN